jgi:hypothetical protein
MSRGEDFEDLVDGCVGCLAVLLVIPTFFIFILGFMFPVLLPVGLFIFGIMAIVGGIYRGVCGIINTINREP